MSGKELSDKKRRAIDNLFAHYWERNHSKLATKFLNLLKEKAKDYGVTLNMGYRQGAEFSVHSDSYLDIIKDNEKLRAFAEAFFEQSAKDFFETRISNEIDIMDIFITNERGFNSLYQKETQTFKRVPYVRIRVTVLCDDFPDNEEEDRCQSQ